MPHSRGVSRDDHFESPGLPPEQFLEGEPGRSPLYPLLACMHLADALHQKLGIHLFEDDAPDAHANRLHKLILVDFRRVEDDPGGEFLGQQFAGDRQAILSGHADVQNDDIGLVSAHGRQGGHPVDAPRQQFEILLELEEVSIPFRTSG